MAMIEDFIQEIRRRSVWQVLGIYLSVSYGVLEAVDLLKGMLPIPDWTTTASLVLLSIGLPVCLVTVVVQKRLPGRASDSEDPSAGHTMSPDGLPENLATGTGSLDRPTTRATKFRTTRSAFYIIAS